MWHDILEEFNIKFALVRYSFTIRTSVLCDLGFSEHFRDNMLCYLVICYYIFGGACCPIFSIIQKRNKLLGRPGCIIEEQKGLGGNQSEQLEEEMLWGGCSLLEA